jgi:hypothetical protein
MAHDVFVSYSSHDKPIADAVVAGLESRGIRCWIAPRDIMPGSSWGEAIINAIEGSRLMVIILSEHSNRSNQVIREVERAVANNVIIIPFRIENIDPSGAMAYFLSTEHWLDAITPPVEAHIQKLGSTIQLFQEQGQNPPIASSTQAGSAGVSRLARRKTLWQILAVSGLGVAVLLITVFIVFPGLNRPTSVANPSSTEGSTRAAETQVNTAQSSDPLKEPNVPELIEIGRFQTAGSAMGLFAVDGETLYLASEVEGLTTISIRDPAAPVEMAHTPAPMAQDLAVAGSFAYLIQGEFDRELAVIELEEQGRISALPENGDHQSLGTDISRAVVADQLLHVSGHNYWAIYDIQSPLEPQFLFSWEPPEHSGNPCTVFIEGQTAYVGAGWAGLFIFDIRNAREPVLLGQYKPIDWVIDIVVQNQIACLTIGDKGLLVLDVQNPAQPRMLSLMALPGFASKLSVSGQTAYVICHQDSPTTEYHSALVAIRISDPGALVVSGRYDKLYLANDLQAEGDTIYIADEPVGLIVLEAGLS